MSKSTVEGYVLLADITGYTSYVAATELEHSQEVLAELLELLVLRLKKIFQIVKLEGDAVFAHLPDQNKTTFNELHQLIGKIYFEYKTKIKQIALNTNCNCNACILIPKLDLKFFIHYGSYVVQDIAGIKELVGSDVNLLHRLTKNKITKHTGWNAYALFTEAALPSDFKEKEDMYKHHETYEHLGDVVTFNVNLLDWFKNSQASNRQIIKEEDADLVLKFDYDFPPKIVFEWITSNEKRNLLNEGSVWSSGYRPKGGEGVGVKNHCAHGGAITRETVLDWSPPDYYTVRSQDNLEKESLFDGIYTFQFKPTKTGTLLQQNIKFSMASSKEQREEFINFFGPVVTNTHQGLNEKLKKLIN